MRVLLALAVLIPICLTVLLLARWALRSGTPGVGADRLALHMARHLDAALTDPVLRQSTAWEDEARRLVSEFYGERIKR
jgi:hypothetical protein